MYNNFRYKRRASIRHSGGFGNGFANRSPRNKFSPSRSSNSGRNQRKSQLEGADINMFIKKANPTSIQDTSTESSISFEQLDICQNLKINLKIANNYKGT